MSDAGPEIEAAGTYFLSYSRSDERFALRLAKDLRAEGVPMWIDQLDIRPSQHWDRAIERAVQHCRGLVVILSPRSIASDNVADEISYAIDSGKSVLPVMIERCTLPLRITRMHVVDATSNYEKAFRQCLDELRRPQSGRSRAEPEARPQKTLDAETVATAKRQLATILGPIAAKVVDKAAGHASSARELQSLLMQHIEDEADRKRFAAAMGGAAAAPVPAQPEPTAAPEEAKAAPQAASVPQADVEALARGLAGYLGPIATVIARRESRECATLEDLRKRLAAKIPKDTDRAEFLRRSQLSA